MKVAYVVPRYGSQIRGGAETGARMLAEHLVADRGDQVEVFTSAALDALTWRDELPPGPRHQRGHRAPDRLGGGTGRGLPSPVRAAAGRSRPRRRGGLRSAGSTCRAPSRPTSCGAVEASDADVIAFYPYLYYPTIRGLPLVQRPGHPPSGGPRGAGPPPAASSTPCSPSAAASPSTPGASGVWWWSASASPPRRRWSSASGSKRPTDRPRRPGPRSGWARRRTCCASGGWTTRRGRGSSGATSAPTRSATRVISASSWWGRSSTHPTTGATSW